MKIRGIATDSRGTEPGAIRARAIHIAWVATAITCLAGLPACNRRKAPATRTAPSKSAVVANDAGPKPLRRKPKTSAELPTTDADIYLGNLDSQIEELTRLLVGAPDQISHVVRLSSAHHARGRYKGDVEEIQLGIDAATRCTKLAPTNASCFLMRAEQEQSLHRFKEAREDLDRARALGADAVRIDNLETELAWNDGRYEVAIPAIRKARVTRPSTATWIREAQLEHDIGNEDAADAAFEAAEDLVRDTGPLVVAHLNLQRGIQKQSTGRLEEACVFFREAVARMPTYVAANEHLAEALESLGQDDEATRIYERVVALSDDPEFQHALAALMTKQGKKAEAKALEAKARARYEVLVRKFPEAMYWHASEFYAEQGDKKRSLELLQKNAALRPNGTSFVALAAAELDNGRLIEAKKSIDKALAMPVVSATLFWTAARIATRQSDAGGAESFRARALRINPRIASEEPPL